MSDFNPIAVVLGSAFIGGIINWGLYGVTIAQTIFYFLSFPEDGLMSKASVAFLSLADTFHLYLIAGLFWNALVAGRKLGPEVLLTIPWDMQASFIVSAVVAYFVQISFARRVWKVSNEHIFIRGHLAKNVFITGSLILAATIQFGSGMYFTCHSLEGHSGAHMFDRPSSISGRITLITSIICDVGVSATLVYFFHGLRVGMKGTKAVLKELIILLVNMGLLLCIGAVIQLILFEGKSGNFIVWGPNIIISKLYVNSYLGILNSRKRFRSLAHPTTEGIELTDISLSATNNTGTQCITDDKSMS